MKHWQDIVSTTVLVGGGGIIILVLSLRGGFNLTAFTPKAPATSLTQPASVTSAPVLTPKEVVQRYYQLAPTNKAAAIELLSEPWREAEQRKKRSGSSFWDAIDRVDIYALKTLTATKEAASVRIWLKYYPKDRSDTPCESMTFQLIFDERVNQWLLDSASDVVQEPNCGT